MQRGVLTLNRNEFNSLLNILDINIFTGTQLFEKFNSASQSTEEELQILLSEDEIEKIMDEIGIPNPDDTLLTSALEKINNLMMSFRK